MNDAKNNLITNINHITTATNIAFIPVTSYPLSQITNVVTNVLDKGTNIKNIL